MANKNAPQPSSANNGNALFVLAILGLLVVGAAVIAYVATNRDSGEEAGGDASSEQADASTAPVTITGDPLSPFADGDDPTVGQPAPEVSGTDFDGSEAAITADGRPKVIYFVAHWCPHCQEEVPAVQKLIDEGKQPEGLDIYAVSTSVDEGGGNFPPSKWLADEGFEPPVIRDDADGSAMAAFGGTSFPFTVYLDGENNVVARTAGQLPPDQIEKLWIDTAAAGA